VEATVAGDDPICVDRLGASIELPVLSLLSLSEKLQHSDDKSPQSESLSPSPRANLEYAMLIRTRKATFGWIKTGGRRRVFRSLKWESDLREKTRSVSTFLLRNQYVRYRYGNGEYARRYAV
jgi:hypothetical protein